MHAVWQQNYDPAGNIWLSALVALIPIVLFLACLTVLRMKGWLAATLTILTTLAVALFFYGMPVSQTAAAAVYGFFFGLWPIAWIVVAALFLYNISVRTGQFDIIRESVLSITGDQRLQLLLVGFCFGALLEGAIGFGAPVAITAALLMGLGFRPLHAAGLCLVANTAPVAFGAVGIPIIVAGEVSGIPVIDVSAMVGRQLPFLTIIIVFVLMAIMDGWRGIKETWPAVLLGGGSFAIVQYYSSNHLGPELPDILSAVVALVVTATFLKFWQPASIFRYADNVQGSVHLPPDAPEARPSADVLTMGKIVYGWFPIIALIVAVTVWSVPPFKQLFTPDGALHSWIISVSVPWLDNLVQKMPPVVAEATNYAAVYKFDWFSASGTAILIAAIISVVVARMKISTATAVLGETFKQMAVPIYIIGMVLAFAFLANYSGLSVTLALALAHTGKAFAFFSPFLGWIGVFLTGSDTSANALFGALQATTAQQVGIPEVLAVAANSSGGVVGKMISPQSIAIACAAVGLVGQESSLLRFTLKYSLVFGVLIGILTALQAYVMPWMIPGI